MQQHQSQTSSGPAQQIQDQGPDSHRSIDSLHHEPIPFRVGRTPGSTLYRPSTLVTAARLRSARRCFEACAQGSGDCHRCQAPTLPAQLAFANMPRMAKQGEDAAMDVSRLASNVRALRLARDLSTHDLDRSAGLSIGVTSRIENQKRPRVEMKTVRALAGALGVSVDALVHPTTPPAPRAEPVVERAEMPEELAELLAAERARGREWPRDIIDAALTIRHYQGERMSHEDWRSFLNELELTARRPPKLPPPPSHVPSEEEEALERAERMAALQRRREAKE